MTASTDAVPFSLLGDQPDEGADDPLGFKRMAENLAALVLASRQSTPLTIGIEAGWGMGKSTLMRRLWRELEGTASVTTVWFNAWTAQEGDALEGLLKSVLDKLDPNILRRALRNKRLTALSRAGARTAAKILKVDPIVDELWQQVKVDPKARNELEDLVKEAMREWTAKTSGTAGRLLVVFIDDLDRCPPANVFQVFEAVKLYLNAPGFLFVIGYDSDVVSDAILREKQYSSNVRSRDYLEKIVQIDYALPTPSEDAGRALLKKCLEESGIQELLDHPAQTLLLERNDRNPRRIKRFLNGFILEYQRTPDRRREDAGRLIRWLVLRRYFAEFTTLFAEPKADPVEEFSAYRDARQLLRAAAPGQVPDGDRQKVADVFGKYGIAPTGASADDLARLEKEVPEAFPTLVQNQAFGSLIEPWRKPPERAWLRDMLQQRPAPPIVADSDATPAHGLAGFKILWIDDEPANNARLVDSLRRSGAEVALATGLSEAMTVLGSTAIDAIVSDIGRNGNPNAGFDDLARIHAARRGRPAIFYSSRVTPSRRERAKKLGAEITSAPGEVLRLLDAVAARRAAQPPGDDAAAE